jgi:hypothetical protein
MRRKLLMLALVLIGAVLGTISPQEASAGWFDCPPVCNDPSQTCCLRCWFEPMSGCVCGNEYICE